MSTLEDRISGLRVVFYVDRNGEHRWNQISSNYKVRSKSNRGYSCLAVAKKNWIEAAEDAKTIALYGWVVVLPAGEVPTTKKEKRKCST